eukprot:29110-Pelagomonas_calceolata.AAC.1
MQPTQPLLTPHLAMVQISRMAMPRLMALPVHMHNSNMKNNSWLMPLPVKLHNSDIKQCCY